MKASCVLSVLKKFDRLFWRVSFLGALNCFRGIIDITLTIMILRRLILWGGGYLTIEPDARPSALELLKDEWLQDA